MPATTLETSYANLSLNQQFEELLLDFWENLKSMKGLNFETVSAGHDQFKEISNKLFDGLQKHCPEGVLDVAGELNPPKAKSIDFKWNASKRFLKLACNRLTEGNGKAAVRNAYSAVLVLGS